ncbi:MAG: MBL fold metallo-hydrolase, partial [Myxococcales bacterium]|nr:MBL fold metallo-hydrolase [Myxococcales bacterium]
MAARSLALTFLGATGTITGARSLLDTGRARVLVDCGLYQGFKQLRLRNRVPFAVPLLPGPDGAAPPLGDTPPIDAVVLQHAHLDHSGYLPRLCRAGFRGPVYCTPGTAALCRLLLPDSAALQLHDAAFANKKGYSKTHPATPLYDLEDAAQALRQLVPVEFGERFNLPGELTASFTRAGHMLGAASLRVDDGVRRVLFSGDLGREQDIMMAPPEPRPHADVVVMESTSGGRAHDGEDPAEALADLIRRTAGRGGKILIPAFAFGRAQALLVLLYQLRRARKIP